MGDMEKNFNRSEFACQGQNCCDHSAPISSNLVLMIQTLRNRLCERKGKNIALRINSGFRCNRHNSSIKKASPKSQHRFGLAADIARPALTSVDELADLAEDIGFHGVGRYSWGVHVDIRDGGNTRWDDRKLKGRY